MGYELILPVIITCVTAHVVAEWLHGRPIYEVLLERGLRLAGHLPRPPSTTVSSPVGTDEPAVLSDPLIEPGRENGRDSGLIGDIADGWPSMVGRLQSGGETRVRL